MGRYGAYRGRSRGPRRLSEKQIAAQREKFDAAPCTAVGKFRRKQLILGHDGKVYRVATIGFRYHEDVMSSIYGVTPARAPKEYTATKALRNAISRVLQTGTHVPASRGAVPGRTAEMPAAAKMAEWEDGQPQSLATFPMITVHEGDYVRVWSPNYDDAASVAWVKDARLAKKVASAIGTAPTPFHIPRAEVSCRLPRK